MKSGKWTDEIINRLARYVQDTDNYRVEFYGFNLTHVTDHVDPKFRTFDIDTTGTYMGQIHPLDLFSPSDFKVCRLTEVEGWYK